MELLQADAAELLSVHIKKRKHDVFYAGHLTL